MSNDVSLRLLGVSMLGAVVLYIAGWLSGVPVIFRACVVSGLIFATAALIVAVLKFRSSDVPGGEAASNEVVNATPWDVETAPEAPAEPSTLSFELETFPRAHHIRVKPSRHRETLHSLLLCVPCRLPSFSAF